MPTLGEVTALLDEWFPPQHADDWDAVGLVLGDPARRRTPDPAGRRPGRRPSPTRRVLHDADLLITHHPLFLKGVHGFAATDPKGRGRHTGC